MGVKIQVFGITDMGKVRTNNEDAFLVADLSREKIERPEAVVDFDVTERGILLAVSDGMGGEQAGEVASALVVESLRKELAEAKEAGADRSAIDERIEKAIALANTEVWKAARAPDKAGMGATLTAVFVEGGLAHIAEVGDSRAYVIRGSRIRQMTKDQSFVQLLLDSGVLSEEEAKNYPHRNVILQAMGQKPEVHVAIGRLQLRRDDVLLLCSDGLSGKVQAEEMLEIVKAERDLSVACRKLVDLANERGGEDNITVVLARADGEDLPERMRDESVTQTYELVKDYAPGRPASQPPKDGGAMKDASAETSGEDKAATAQADAAEKSAKKAPDRDGAGAREEPAETDEAGGADEERAPAPPPTEAQRRKEMATVAVVFLGLAVLFYFVFRG
jgi:serine/threonine protein phosphatase PrpC